MLFETIKVPGSDALAKMDELIRAYPQSGLHPFMIGNDEELEELKARCDAPEDGGALFIEQANQLNIEEWLNAQGFKPPKSLSKTSIEPQSGFSTLFNILTGEPKPEINIGLIKVAKPYHIFAKLGWGGWNDCPDPYVHVALHKYWNERFDSIPVAVSGDIVECYVDRPTTDKADVLKLAGEQYAYCYDIVEQGFNSTTKLASSLVGAKVWYFWWD